MSNEYKQTLQRFEDAVRAHEMMGAQHPDDHKMIQKEYDEAKRALVTKLSYRTIAREVFEEPKPKPKYDEPGFQFEPCPICGSRSLRCGCD